MRCHHRRPHHDTIDRTHRSTAQSLQVGLLFQTSVLGWTRGDDQHGRVASITTRRMVRIASVRRDTAKTGGASKGSLQRQREM